MFRSDRQRYLSRLFAFKLSLTAVCGSDSMYDKQCVGWVEPQRTLDNLKCWVLKPNLP